MKNKKQKLTLMLLRESIWGIEDKLKTIIETQADHEADIIRLKSISSRIINHLKNLNYNFREFKRRLKK